MAEKSFTAARNADFIRTIIVREAGTQTPVDLTGCNFAMHITTAAGAHQVRLEMGDGIAVDDPASGRIRLTIPRRRMRGLVGGTYSQDMLLMRGGVTVRLWHGTLTVEEGVTYAR